MNPMIDWEWTLLVFLAFVVALQGTLSIYFVRWVLWRNKLLTELAVWKLRKESSESDSEE
jgi:hypothetical protein